MIHGFGSYAIFFYELIKHSKNQNIEWSIILPTSHYLKEFQDLIGATNVYYLHHELNNVNKQSFNRAMLGNYYGNIYADIECDKKTIKYKKADKQEKNAFYTYLAYKNIVKNSKVEYMIFPHIESHEGKILHSVAEECNIKTILPTHARNLGGSFFSSKVTEDLPKYATEDIENVKKAKVFLSEMAKEHISAVSYPVELEGCIGSVDDIFKKSLVIRSKNYLKQLRTEASYQSWDGLRYRVLNNLPFLRDFVWSLRRGINQYLCDYKNLEELPEKFIYYPLQYTPESSINTPAPFFIDQLRIIDAIRMAMPSQYILVVKEHPSCIIVRDRSFIKSLQKKAGVKIAYYRINSCEIAQKAGLTISVTGTATWEAFLLGQGSMIFGGTFFAEFLGGVCKLDLNEIKSKIYQALNTPVSLESRIKAVAKVYSIMRPFILFTPGDGTKFGDMTLSSKNVENFLQAMLEHIHYLNLMSRRD